MNKQIKLSVRSLVEFVLRSGSLDAGSIGSNRHVEGIVAHQRHQKESRKSFADQDEVVYEAECSVELSLDYRGYEILVEGRVDGIIRRGEELTVEEIKSTTRDLTQMEEYDNPLHWAQAKCYAFMLMESNGLEHVQIQLTYCSIYTEHKKVILRAFSYDEVQDFFYSLLDRYLLWIDFECNWTKIRNSSIKEITFPHESYRKGQREFAVAVYKTITEGKKLYVQAPTGIGKTISVLFPAIKAMGEGYTSKLFYLTAKTITRKVAEEAVSKLQQNGLKLKSVTLTAKDKVCKKEQTLCNPEYCEYACGYYDRLNEGVLDALKQESLFTREVVESYADKYTLCPFELSLDIALWMDLIICDYNYVFDPRVHLKRFFADRGANKVKNDFAFLIDEAHNLVDRSREMFSASLDKRAFMELKKLVKKDKNVNQLLNRINAAFISYRKQCGEEKHLVFTEEQKELRKLMEEAFLELERWLTGAEKNEAYDKALELYFEISSYLKISEFYDKSYVTYIDREGSEVQIKLYCLDPSYLLSEALKRGRTAIFFSATLTPLNYFRGILGGSEEDYTKRLLSPFDRDNLKLCVADNISTRYRNREKTYEQIAEYLHTVVKQKPGNYFAFFPSYAYMHQVHRCFHESYPETKILLQDAVMTEEDREAFLDCFVSEAGKSMLAFAVMGGIFSEGIDLTGDRLVGAVVVGVGLPQICLERDLVMKYFNEQNSMGFEFSYMYPGMNKVLQAAGRVIRTEQDRGVVVLIDERFTSSGYLRLFPPEWQNYEKTRSKEQLRESIASFWTHAED